MEIVQIAILILAIQRKSITKTTMGDYTTSYYTESYNDKEKIFREDKLEIAYVFFFRKTKTKTTTTDVTSEGIYQQ